jgi:hypothetical protein
MGVAKTHYVVYGVVLTEKEDIEKFRDWNEKYLEFFDEYNDNGYRSEITETPSGLNIIADGMNGKYLVIGKILDKALDEDGLSLNVLSVSLNSTDVLFLTQMLEKGLSKIDEKLGTDLMNHSFRYIAFTHWH